MTSAAIDPEESAVTRRDRAILSKGHGCLALYALLADRGFFPVSELDGFCGTDSILGGHPETAWCPASRPRPERSGTGCRSASAWRCRAHERTGREVYVLIGDGEINEGSVWEAADAARTSTVSTNLVAVIDYNKIQSAARINSAAGAAGGQMAQLRLCRRGAERPQRRGVERALRQGAVVAGKPTRDHLPYREGQGPAGGENNASWHHKNELTEKDLVAIRVASAKLIGAVMRKPRSIWSTSWRAR